MKANDTLIPAGAKSDRAYESTADGAVICCVCGDDVRTSESACCTRIARSKGIRKVCGHCGSLKPWQDGCGCFDNDCQ